MLVVYCMFSGAAGCGQPEVWSTANAVLLPMLEDKQSWRGEDNSRLAGRVEHYIGRMLRSMVSPFQTTGEF